MKQVALSELLEERRERAGSKKLPVYSVSSQLGFVVPEDIFHKTIASENTSNYKVVNVDDFAYNPSRINIGSIALNKSAEKGIVSPMYVVFSIKNKQALEPEYLMYFLKSPHGLSAVNDNTQGAVRFQLRFSDLLRIKIPLPEVAEQRRITLALAEADLLKRHRERADKKMIELQSALFASMFGVPDSWTKNFKTESLASLVEVVSGGTPSRSNPDLWNGDVPWVSAKDMKTDFITDSIEHITKKGTQDAGLKIIKPDSLLVVVRGMILARYIPISIVKKELTINQDLKALVPKERVSGIFLRAALSALAPELSSLVKTAAHGTKKLETADLLKIKIPIPEASLQKRFAQAMQAIEEQQEKQKRLSMQISNLTSAFLAKAYNVNNLDVPATETPVPSPIKVFPIQQAIGVILKNGFERGEMVLGKVLYLGQEVYRVGLGVPFIAYKFGPWDIAVKNAVNGGASKKNQFFKRKKIGKGSVLALGPHANKLFGQYANAAVVKDMNTAMNKLLPLIKYWKSPDIECLATVCKVIQDDKTIDERVIIQKVSEWKPNKFTDDRVQYMVNFIVQHKWDKSLL